MTKEEIKKAYDLANKEIKQDKEKEHDARVDEVKLIVKNTLQEIEKLQDQKKEIDEKLKILKLDIEDLKEGKLERIKERQETDPLAKTVSLIIIKETIREREVPIPSPWYRPYTISWNTPGVVYCSSNTYNDTGKNFIGYASISDVEASSYQPIKFTLNNSIVKDSVVGTYKLTNKIVHLR
jgi:hypothetical protein